MKYYNIPIFVPHKGCPFDCVFCNQKHITGTSDEVTVESVKNTIKEYLKTLPKDDRYVEAAFFGGSFTGIESDLQELFLSAAYEFVKSGDIDGIRLSTRPDYIDKEILDRLKKYGVTTIELGVQSLDDKVLELSGRGHDSKTVKNAVKLIKEYDFSLGLQMMTGLVGDTDKKSLKTADKIIKLKPDFVRIYPTLVVKDTYLEKMYNDGRYIPQSLDGAVELCKKLMIKFKKANVNVIRVSLQTTDEISPGGLIVAGPYDAQFREIVESEMYLDKISKKIKKKKNYFLYVNNKEISKAIGRKRKNINYLYDKFGVNIKVIGKDGINTGEFILKECGKGEGFGCI